jgi:hypothetical protein
MLKLFLNQDLTSQPLPALVEMMINVHSKEIVNTFKMPKNIVNVTVPLLDLSVNLIKMNMLKF